MAETADMLKRISVRPIQRHEKALLEDTSYSTMSNEEKNDMISESLQKKHNGRYFEFLVVEDAGNCVGFMSLYAHSQSTISCGPEIKVQYRCKGYAYHGEQKAFEYAKKLGYTAAVAQVRMTNQASRALHEKLGFELERVYINKKGNEVCEYRKEI